MPRRIITALDLEMADRLGKKEVAVGPEDVITDVARERAAQLEIRITKVSSDSERLGAGGAAAGRDEKVEATLAAPGGDTSLDLFQSELDQLKKEIAQLKLDGRKAVQAEKDKAGFPVAGPSPAGADTLLAGRAPAAEADLVIKNGSLVIPRLGVFKGDLEIVGRMSSRPS